MLATPLDRAYVAALRPVVRLALAFGPVREALARRSTTRLGAASLEAATAALLTLDELTHDSDTSHLPPPAARRRIARAIALTDGGAPVDVETRELTWAGPAGGRLARLYEPRGLARHSPGLLYLHGGGWTVLDVDTHDASCRILAGAARARVVSIDYRLAPEHPFPAAVDDAIDAFRWLVRRAPELGIDPARIGVGGDSAGGNLAAVVGLRTRVDAVRPALQVLIYPGLDATFSSRSHAELGEGYLLTRRMIAWYLERYAGSSPELRTNPDLSPIFAPDVAGAPPALVYTAGFDPLRDEGHAYAARLREAGVRADAHSFSRLIHGFTLFTGVSPASLEATRRIGRELGEALRADLARR